ncbi:MAG: hypothetical protein ACJ8A6_11775 [Gemmatimonadales bacterium]
MAIGSGCSEPAACTLELRRAVQVEVRDAVSDDYIAGVVHGAVRDGSFEDSLRVVGWTGTDPGVTTTLGGADERPGTYAVHLKGAEYQAWDTARVQVSRDECHVQTVSFTARLTPTAP